MCFSICIFVIDSILFFVNKCHTYRNKQQKCVPIHFIARNLIPALSIFYDAHGRVNGLLLKVTSQVRVPIGVPDTSQYGLCSHGIYLNVNA